jgi:hypothetical protein
MFPEVLYAQLCLNSFLIHQTPTAGFGFGVGFLGQRRLVLSFFVGKTYFSDYTFI